MLVKIVLMIFGRDTEETLVMFITYDAKDPNWTIWGSAYDDNKSVLDAWTNVRYYNRHGKTDREDEDVVPIFNTIPCSKELFDMVELNGADENFPWVVRDGVAEYVENPLYELRHLLV